MSIKRKDNKGRILHNGESQRKDGRYSYKYLDLFGKQRFIYSWRLTEVDPQRGKKKEISLREKEKQILKDLEDEIDVVGKDIKVIDLVERYVVQKRNVKYTTQLCYKVVINLIKKYPFSMKKITNVKKSDVKLWLCQLKAEGYSYNTIGNVRKVLRPAFEMAVEDDLIKRNPFQINICDIIENDTKKREALNAEDEQRFIQYAKEYSCFNKTDYFNDIVILLNTGLRISELCGLTIKDLDFENRIIHINKQLQRKKNMEYMVSTLKTKNSYRDLPMTDIVYRALQNVIKNRRECIYNEIDGYKGFIFIDYYGKPKVSSHYHNYFKCLLDSYNKANEKPLPKITPHVLRHTYCTKMVYKGMNPKVLQYLMGHSDINITLNLYTHASIDNVKEEMRRIYMI